MPINPASTTTASANPIHALTRYGVDTGDADMSVSTRAAGIVIAGSDGRMIVANLPPPCAQYEPELQTPLLLQMRLHPHGHLLLTGIAPALGTTHYDGWLALVDHATGRLRAERIMHRPTGSNAVHDAVVGADGRWVLVGGYRYRSPPWIAGWQTAHLMGLRSDRLFGHGFEQL